MFFNLVFSFKFKMAGWLAKCLGLPFWQIGKKLGQNGAKCVKCVLGGWGHDQGAYAAKTLKHAGRFWSSGKWLNFCQAHWSNFVGPCVDYKPMQVNTR